ncbi:early nodulin-like protein 9 [Artemisia annua]|uniref:Early nodulin-like protein 9 n=1 Tax=Artemisia annua TaxID=35608 RepID=A0A2U1MH15_ARTAN|nr:early nodulin-like protein 9 [Artemisia annua]
MAKYKVAMALLSFFVLIQNNGAYETVIVSSDNWSSPSSLQPLSMYEAEKNSVVQITQEDYIICNATSPVSANNSNGYSVLKLNQRGPSYFISGIVENCKCKNNGTIVIVVIKDGTPPKLKNNRSPPPPKRVVRKRPTTTRAPVRRQVAASQNGKSDRRDVTVRRSRSPAVRGEMGQRRKVVMGKSPVERSGDEVVPVSDEKSAVKVGGGGTTEVENSEGSGEVMSVDDDERKGSKL